MSAPVETRRAVITDAIMSRADRADIDLPYTTAKLMAQDIEMALDEAVAASMRREWTQGEIDELTKLTAEGLGAGVIARRMGRSRRSVESRMKRQRSGEPS